MNWKTAICILRNGGKITRPNWEAEHFWVLSKDGYERILCYDGTNASVHIEQLEADDWELWRVRETIEEKFQEFNYKHRIYPNVMFVGDIGEKFQNFVDNGMKLYGMEIRNDESLKDGEFKICFEEKEVKCFWCDKYTSDIIKHTNEMHPGLCPRSYGFIKVDRIC